MENVKRMCFVRGCREAAINWVTYRRSGRQMVCEQHSFCCKCKDNQRGFPPLTKLNDNLYCWSCRDSWKN